MTLWKLCPWEIPIFPDGKKWKYQLLLGITGVFPSCIFSDIKYKIQRSFMSSLNVSITSFYYRSFSPTFTQEDQFYIAQKGFDTASPAAPIQLSPHGPGAAPELLTNHWHCCWILLIIALTSIPVPGLEQGMLVSSLFWLKTSSSRSQKAEVICY